MPSLPEGIEEDYDEEEETTEEEEGPRGGQTASNTGDHSSPGRGRGSPRMTATQQGRAATEGRPLQQNGGDAHVEEQTSSAFGLHQGFRRTIITNRRQTQTPPPLHMPRTFIQYLILPVSPASPAAPPRTPTGNKQVVSQHEENSSAFVTTPCMSLSSLLSENRGGSAKKGDAHGVGEGVDKEVVFSTAELAELAQREADEIAEETRLRDEKRKAAEVETSVRNEEEKRRRADLLNQELERRRRVRKEKIR